MELKPCPFCGGEAELIKDLYTEAPDFGCERIPELDEYYVECKECGVVQNGWGTGGWSSKGKAISVWNTRVNPITEV